MLHIAHRINTIPEIIPLLSDDTVDVIEMDIHQCSSGELIVFHDRIMGDKYIHELDLVDILAENPLIPTLSEVLMVIWGKKSVYLDIKTQNRKADTLLETLRGTIETMKKMGWSNKSIIVASFNHYFIKQLIGIGIKLGLILDSLPVDYLSLPWIQKVDFIVVGKYLITKELIHEAHYHNLSIYAYTANNLKDWEFLTEIGVDGIVYDI